MKEYMDELRHTDVNDPRFKKLIKNITANFDEFKETGAPLGMGNVPMQAQPATALLGLGNGAAANNGPMSPGGGGGEGHGTPVLRMDKNDTFLGYTYKRKPVSLVLLCRYSS